MFILNFVRLKFDHFCVNKRTYRYYINVRKKARFLTASMASKLLPRESGKFIAENAKHVIIKQEGVKRLAHEVVMKSHSGEISINNFSQNEVHPKDTDPWAIEWLFVVDTLNFCFWSSPNVKGWTVDGYTGYFALCAAINRAMRENFDILNAEYYSKITQDDAEKIFRTESDEAIPLLNERIKALHEVGKVLLEKYDGKFENVVNEANHSTKTLLSLIVDNFPCFQDEAVYEGQTVTFYKRAQILIGDIWSCFRGEGKGYFKDIGELTMFADYRVPQSLIDFGALEYSEELKQKLQDDDLLLRNGDPMEVEIRGCSIHVCECVKTLCNNVLPEKILANSVLIDHFLWDYRRKHAQEIYEKKIPFHKTRCIYY